jgi:N-acetylglucosamine kinase-like BadF-type ATPase
MILVADSGSTKTEWKVINSGAPGESIFTSGINPFFLSGQEIYNLLKKELHDLEGGSFSHVYYYGTGCSSVVRENTVKDAIVQFLSADEIFVGSDMLAAARSLCMTEPGIACIIGTGSNSCYFDGKAIVSNVAPLGYILGDEAGAAVIGRKLISGVLKKQVSPEVIDLFFETYKITPGEILENVYMKPFPNRFLGQFARFISANIRITELQDIINSCFDDFIVRNILQYPESEYLPVHFTGSIAFHFKPFLEELLQKHNLKRGKITLSPMAQLIEYHIENLKPGRS